MDVIPERGCGKRNVIETEKFLVGVHLGNVSIYNVGGGGQAPEASALHGRGCKMLLSRE